jgi:hypothetical protein
MLFATAFITLATIVGLEVSLQLAYYNANKQTSAFYVLAV